MIKQLCICEVCHHMWMAPEVPKRCANCKNRAWNGYVLPPAAPKECVSGRNSATIDPEVLERIESAGPPVAELADTGEPYKRSEGALADKLKAALADPKPVKSPYCRHGLAYHPGCNA